MKLTEREKWLMEQVAEGSLVNFWPYEDWLKENEQRLADEAPANKVFQSHEGCNAFWKYWQENGESGKHGVYESTWGALRAYFDAVDSQNIYYHHNIHLDAEEYECAMMVLDDMKIPRADDGGKVYSLVGRIKCLAAEAPDNGCICVPKSELEKLENARVHLFKFLEPRINDFDMSEIQFMAIQVWKVANTKNWQPIEPPTGEDDAE